VGGARDSRARRNAGPIMATRQLAVRGPLVRPAPSTAIKEVDHAPHHDQLEHLRSPRRQ
jgi:hypothetical protein